MLPAAIQLGAMGTLAPLWRPPGPTHRLERACSIRERRSSHRSNWEAVTVSSYASVDGADDVPDAVVAGHVSLDVFPALRGPVTLEPGRLVVVGPAVTSTGGAVTNTGLALHRLGVSVRLVGRVGADLFGRAVLDALAEHGERLADGMVVSAAEATSYTIVINPPGVDRSFLHCPGANRTFSALDVPYETLDGRAPVPLRVSAADAARCTRTGVRSCGTCSRRCTSAGRRRGWTSASPIPRTKAVASTGRRCWPTRFRSWTCSRRASTTWCSCSISPRVTGCSPAPSRRRSSIVRSSPSLPAT